MRNIHDVIIERIHEDAVIPTYGSEHATCADVYSIEDCILQPGLTKNIRTGLKFHIPEGYGIQVRSRSGLATTGIQVKNSPATVDEDYRGELFILLSWDGTMSEKYTDRIKTNFPVVMGLGPAFNEFHIQKGDRIAQICIEPVYKMNFIEGPVSEDTKRGTDGLGSTGLGITANDIKVDKFDISSLNTDYIRLGENVYVYRNKVYITNRLLNPSHIDYNIIPEYVEYNSVVILEENPSEDYIKNIIISTHISKYGNN